MTVSDGLRSRAGLPSRAGRPAFADAGAARLPEEAFAAALAGLPHLTPFRLRGLLAGRSPARAWAGVRRGEVLVGGGDHPGPPDDTCERPVGAADGGPGLAQSAWRGSSPLSLVGTADPALGRASYPAAGPEPDDHCPRRAHWTPSRLAASWAEHARGVDLPGLWEAHRAAGVAVHLYGSPSYPAVMASDPSAPAVLFSVGSLAALACPRAAVIGTRSASHYGEEVAAELGLGLARAGVAVVSGLALGIDGAAHTGALAGAGAPPLGVVGSGLDVVYPAAHARLWARVRISGGLISESPLGARAQGWRFPWRNRLLAALAEVVVVVESHRGGGSLLTVEAAARRGVPVLAVPGSVRSPASEGTNALLADGCAPARDVHDVLAALGLQREGKAGLLPAQPLPPTGLDGAVWAALEAEPTPTETIMRRTGLSPGQVAAVLARLEEGGWVEAGPGWWERRRPGPSQPSPGPPQAGPGLGRSPGRRGAQR